MPLFGELFLSEIIKKPVLDFKGDVAGKLKDILIIKGLPLPVISALLVKRGKKTLRIDWGDVNIFNRRIISTKLLTEEASVYIPRDEDLFAVRDILDRQIVDANGAKVVRVNDIKLEGYNSQAVLSAVDIGMRGIMRRLRVEKKGGEILKLFRIRLPYNLISWNYIQPLEPKLKSIALTVPRQMMSELHPADIAEIISSVSRDEGASLFRELNIEAAADTLPELEPEVQTALISDMEPEKASDIIEQMEPDEAADLLSDLPAATVKILLELIEKEDAEDIQELLSHEEDTAGGLMTSEFLSYPSQARVCEVMERFRADAEETENIYYIYVTDEQEKLIGVVSLRELILADPDKYPEKTLSGIMETNIKKVRVEDDESIVAAAISKYNLVAIPVVNEEDIILGIVTVDDIIDRILPPKAKRKKRKV
ncbi:magnesium transporter MgtE [bacterium BMS3Abin07]|nr:magnesium transporter MgtE [bacterium BMS3Abin07]GBE33154.1 magnesium transporter MgtE [bacterium BMS3Bbin05]HDO22638.1 magnesium transporter [Nitrospirota bacterium]HDZ87642.1 magnesium transporter [Nitrospirota bacterium]